MTATTTTEPTAPSIRFGPFLVVVLGGLFMNLLDISIVNVAIGSLRRQLHADGAELQLIVSGYVLAYAVLLITGARLGDRLGHRRMFEAGLLGFVVASAACGLAWSPVALIVFRVLQGAAAAAMLPQVMSLIQICCPPGPVRARALGWYGLVLALGTVAGQLLGGIILQVDVGGIGWRGVFLVNVPIGLALLALARRHLPNGTARAQVPLDLAGVISLGTALALLIVPLVLGHENHWSLWGFAAWVVGGVAVAIFIVIERRAVAPVISGTLLRTPGLAPGIGVLLLVISSYAAYLFCLSVHLQTALGMGPLATGLAFAPLAAGFAAASPSSPRLPRTLSRALIPAGLATSALAYPLLGLVLADDHQPGAAFFGLLVLLGLAQGYAVTPVMGLALARVPATRAGESSGLLSCTFQLAQVVGVATVGSVFLAHTAVAGSASGLGLMCWICAAALTLAIGATTPLLRASR